MSTPFTILSTEGVAELLKVSPELVRKWRSSGDGPPALKLGDGRNGTVRYRLADVLAWLETRKVQQDPPGSAA